MRLKYSVVSSVRIVGVKYCVVSRFSIAGVKYSIVSSVKIKNKIKYVMDKTQVILNI